MNNPAFEELKNEKYPVKISFDENDGVYVTEFLDLPGCSAYGDTVEDSYRKAEEAKAEWMRVSFEQGLPIPKPSRREEHSGRILLRLPSSLHGLLADRAKLSGASLNQYLLHLLSVAAVGDELGNQIETLTRRIGQLEFRIGQFAVSQKPTQVLASQPKLQVSTATNFPVSGSMILDTNYFIAAESAEPFYSSLNSIYGFVQGPVVEDSLAIPETNAVRVAAAKRRVRAK